MKKRWVVVINFFFCIGILSAATITVNSPLGGHEFKVGDSISVAWKGSGVSGDVRISLRRADGSGGEEIKKAHPFGSSPVVYKIPPTVLKPGEAQAFFFVRIKKNATQGQSGTFKISASGGMLTLKKPNGGERWEKGYYEYITWDSTGVKGNVRLKLYRNGREAGVIGDVGISASQNSYRWKVGALRSASAEAGFGYGVGIETLDGKIKDMSDKNFEILRATNLPRIDPNAGNTIVNQPVSALAPNSLLPVIVAFKAYGNPEPGGPVQLYYHYQNATKDFYIINRTTGKKHTFKSAKYPEWEGSFFPTPQKSSRYEIGVSNNLGTAIDDVQVIVKEKLQLDKFYTNKTSFYLNDEVEFWFQFKGAAMAFVEDVWNHKTVCRVNLKGRYRVFDSCRFKFIHPGSYVLFLEGKDGKEIKSKPVPIRITDPGVKRRVMNFKIDKVRPFGTLSGMDVVWWEYEIMGPKKVEIFHMVNGVQKSVFAKKYTDFDRQVYNCKKEGMMHINSVYPATYIYQIQWWENNEMESRTVVVKPD